MKKYIALFLCCISLAFPAIAAEYEKILQELITLEMKKWSHRDIVVDAIKSQNSKHANLSTSDMKILNSKWKGEKRKNKKPLTKKVLTNELSDYLRKIQEDGEGVYTEIIIIDNMGLNVGQSILSEDYWQVGQQKWEKTFGTRSYATYISDLRFDDNTELFQVEVSFMIIADEEPIGLVYAGIDVEQLEDWKKRQELQ